MALSTAKLALRGVVRPRLDALAPNEGDVERYRRDPFAHVDDGHVKIIDVETHRVIPLTPMDHQRAFAAEWIDLERLATMDEDPDLPGFGVDGLPLLMFRNVVIEKTRQMGMTWWIAWLVLWALTYHPVVGGYQNMDKGEVDDGGRNSSTDSFFGKVRFLWDQLPAQHRAPLRWRGGNDPSIGHRYERRYIVGEGAVANPGRGGTYDYWVQDEAARIPFDKSAQAALTLACPSGRAYNSTPEGEDNEYFRLVDERPDGYRFVRFHWTQHPYYRRGLHIAGVLPHEQPTREMAANAADCDLCEGNRLGLKWSASEPFAHRYEGKLTSPWYDRKVIDLTDEQVARELDIDYQASLEARVYAEFNDDVHVVPLIEYDPAFGVELAWDYGLDVTAVAILQDTPYDVRQIGELEISDARPAEVAAALRERLGDLGLPLLQLQPEWTARMFAVGDPAGEGRTLATAQPLTADYAREGFSIVSKPETVNRTILSFKGLLLGRPKPFRISKATCPETIKHAKANRWPVTREGKRRPGATAPQDDEHNHMMRALAYWAAFKYPTDEDPAGSQIPPEDPERLRVEGRIDAGVGYDMGF